MSVARLDSLISSSCSEWRLKCDVVRGWRDGTPFAKEDDVSVVVEPYLRALIYAGRRHGLNAKQDDLIAIRQPLVVNVPTKRRTHNAVAISVVQLEGHHFGTIARLHRFATSCYDACNVRQPGRHDL